MLSISPSSDLRNNYNEISQFCHKYNEPMVMILFFLFLPYNNPEVNSLQLHLLPYV